MCLSFSVLGTRMSYTENWTWGLTDVGQKNHKLRLDGAQIFQEKRYFWAWHVPAHYNVPTAGECACPAHATNEGWQDDDATSCLITLDTCFTMRF